MKTIDRLLCVFHPIPRVLCFMGFVFCIVCLPACVWGQDFASITGTARDQSGAALPGVLVTATNEETGLSRHTISSRAGAYELLSLPVGRYLVTAEKSGFESVERPGLTLTIGEQVTLNFLLRLGKVRERITVTGEPGIVSTSVRDVSGLVGERQVKELPLNGRSYDELMTLDPGVVNYTSEKTGGVGVSNSAVANMFAVSGRRPQENLFLLNGVEYTGEAEINLQPGGTSGQLLGVDAVREFNVLTNTYGAEYGKRPGAQVIIVTQSGTKQVHGSAYEFLRNSAFDARNFFDRGPVPNFQRNQFGGALGGPLRKDGTFLFGNYEGYRQHLGLSDVTLVPDDNARQGLLPGPNGTFINVGIAPAATPLLSLWPVQNGPELGNGIALAYSHPLQTIREDFGSTRFDQNLRDADFLSAVYTIDDSSDRTPTSNPLSLDLESLREQVLSLTETHVFSSSLLNTARLGFSRASYFYTGETTVNVPGFIVGRPVGAVVIGGSATPNSQSQISLAGSNIGSNLFGARNLFTYEDRLTLSRGVHQITAGAWFERIQANDRWALGQYGQAVFSNLESFLKGVVANFSAIPAPTLLGWRSWEGAGYAEDTMRLKPNLSVSLGLRVEFTDGWNEAFGRAANYVFDPNGVIETEPRVAASAFTVNNARFLPQPRVGIAWDPFGRGRTVIHAGFGIYNDLQDGLGYRLDQNAHFNTSFTLNNVTLSTFPFEPGIGVPAGAKVAPAGVQPNLQTPTIESYTLRIDHELGPDTVLRIGYAGSHAYHEIVSIDANEPVPVICPAAPCTPGLPAGTLFYPKGAPLRNPDLANTWSWFSEGDSFYNALQIDFDRHFSRGLGIRGVYTWSKSMDNGDTLNGIAAANAPGLVMNPGNLALDWGPSTFDVRNVAVINGSCELPIGRGRIFFGNITGWREKMLGGWTMDGIATFQSGFPFTPQLSFNPSNNGDTRNPVRPSWNPAFTGKVILGGPNRYFDPDAFVVPPNGTYGNVGRDTLTGPGLATLDLALLKNTHIFEKVSLQFRGEFFNVLNRANFNTPNTIVFTSASGVPSSAAGVITSTSTSSRQVQFGLKLIW